MSDNIPDIDKRRKHAQKFWAIYSRLTGYVLRSKKRLIALIIFSCLAASPLGIILITVPSVLKVMYVSGESDSSQITGLSQEISTYTETVNITPRPNQIVQLSRRIVDYMDGATAGTDATALSELIASDTNGPALISNPAQVTELTDLVIDFTHKSARAAELSYLTELFTLIVEFADTAEITTETAQVMTLAEQIAVYRSTAVDGLQQADLISLLTQRPHGIIAFNDADEATELSQKIIDYTDTTQVTELTGLIVQYTTFAAGWADKIQGWTGRRPDLERHVEATIIAIRTDPTYGIRLIAVGIVLITFLGGVARYGQQFFGGVISADVVESLRNEFFESVLKQSHDFFEQRPSGKIMARFSNDVMMVNTGLISVFVILFREPVKVFLLLAVAFLVSPKITVLIIFFISPLILLFMLMAKKVKRRVTSKLNRLATVTSILMETLHGITVVKSFRMEEFELASMRKELRALRIQMVKMSRLNALVGPITELFLICGSAVLLLMGSRIMVTENLHFTDLITLAGAMIAIVDPMRKIAKINNKIQVSAVSGERVFAYIDAQPTVQEAPQAVDFPVIQHEIAFNHVDFSYRSDTPVLKDLNFTVKKGEMVALVGFSGAGKSTIAKLLPRFYDPSAGSITIDGVDIREASFESLREQIGYVTQDNVLFNRSVHENISFSRDTITKEQVRTAAKVAHADVFIDPMSEGYDSSISEAGSNLSGGQKQRIAIARAIVKDPAILILDEATSSLDTESEAAIQQAIDKFVVGRTTIVIAHRLSTIQRADRIIVLSHGTVAEQGTHHELVELGGIYSRLHTLQFAAVLDPTESNNSSE